MAESPAVVEVLTEDEPLEPGSTDPTAELEDTVVLPDVEPVVWAEEPPSATAEEF